MSGRHAANSWESYLSAHHGRLEDFLDHFVERDTLDIEIAENTALWTGVLYCRDGIEIQVEKRQRTWLRSGRRWVETIGYSYHVMIRAGDGVRGLFRYDNAHPHPGHADPHHRHEFTGDSSDESVRWVGEAGWPTLGDVIAEAHGLWWRTK